MSATEDDLYLENIDEYVHDMDKIVTYKWLAMTLSVSFSEATRMLDTFVRQHSAPPSRKEPIAVTYLVTGVSHDSGNDKVIISLAEEDDLEEVKAGLTEVHSVIIYSVQKGVLKDRSALFSAEYESLKDNIHKYAEMGAVKCTSSSLQHGEPLVTPNKAHLALPSLSHVKEEKSEQKTHQDQKLSQKQHDHQGQKSDHKLGHQEKPSQHHKGHHKVVSSNKGGGLVAMFAKKNAQKSTKTAAKDNSKQKDDRHDNVVKSEPQSKVSKPDKQVSKQVVKREIAETTTAKEQPSSGEEEEAGRIVFDKEVFTSSEDEAPAETSKKMSPEVKREVKRPTKDKKTNKAPKRRRVCQELSSGESDTETVKVNEGSGGQKRRKVVRKLVNKMFIDDDGAMVTEKEWQEISTTDDDEELVVTPATATAATNKTSTKTKSKQATLGAFFNRK